MPIDYETVTVKDDVEKNQYCTNLGTSTIPVPLPIWVPCNYPTMQSTTHPRGGDMEFTEVGTGGKPEIIRKLHHPEVLCYVLAGTHCST